MRSPHFGLGVSLCFCIALSLCGSRAAAQGSDDNKKNGKQFTNGLNGAVNLAGAASALIDKSPVARYLNNLDIDGPSYPKDVRDKLARINKQIKSELVPKEVFCFELETRRVGERTYYAPAIVYGNGPQQYDIGLQGLVGSSSGFGFALRYHPFDYNPKALESSVAYIKSITDKYNTRGVTDDAENVKKIAREEAVRWAKNYLSPKLSLITDYRKIIDIGDLCDAGVSASVLIPLQPHRTSSGILLLASAQQIWFATANSQLRSASGVGFGLSIAGQDQVPYTYELRDKNGKPLKDDQGNPITKAQLARWHVQYGFEYNFRNAVVDRNAYAFFLRFRDKGSGEYTLSVGEAADRHGFIGLGLSTHFHL